jgi:uncharacterized membrane protein YcaP (DUF421 family)
MESVLRAAVVYVFLLVLFRIAGKRTLSQISTFDFILLLIISEATQQALIDDDNSMTNAFILIMTLVALNIALSLLKNHVPWLEKWLEGTPLLVVDQSQPLKQRMAMERVDEADVLTAAREMHGLERMDQVKYAVLERSGGISVIPRDSK